MTRARLTGGILAAGMALGLMGCSGSTGTFEIRDFNLPQVTLPVQFQTPLTYPTLSGQVTGLALGNFDGIGRTDAATFVKADPTQPLTGGSLAVFQGGVDPLSQLARMDITTVLALQQVQSLLTSPTGDLITSSSSVLGTQFGLLRLTPPLVTGPFVPGPLDRQLNAPFPDSVGRDAKLASLSVAGTTLFAIPGIYPGPISGVGLFRSVNMEQAPIGTPFINTGANGIVTPTAVACGDFNGDGLVDLAVQGNGKVLVYAQQAGANFSLLATLPLSAASLDIASGLLDSNSRADLVVSTGSGMEVYLNGNFSQAATTRLFPLVKEVHCGDLNGDGITDIYGIFGADQERLYVGLGVGDGTFPTIIPGDGGGIAGVNELRDVQAGQVSGQGAIDLVFLRRTPTSGQVVVTPVVFK